MTGRVDNEEALKDLVASGLFPAIKNAIQKYENTPDSEKYLYRTAFMIGEYIDTYHKFFMTGNSVEMVKDAKGGKDTE